MYQSAKKIVSLQNDVVKKTVALLKNRKTREEEVVFVAEGLRLCSELAPAGAMVRDFFYTEKARDNNPEVIGELFKISTNCYEISEEVAVKMGGTEHSQGVIAVCMRPAGQNAENSFKSDEKYLFLENIADPGNMGSLIRTAAAFGINAVYANASCVDIYSPKVVRAGMGGHFKMPIFIVDSLVETIEKARQNGVAVYATALGENSVNLKTISPQGSAAVVIGGEANGLTKEVVAACTTAVIIPMAPGNESLNAAAAGAVAMWELCKNNLQ